MRVLTRSLHEVARIRPMTQELTLHALNPLWRAMDPANVSAVHRDDAAALVAVMVAASHPPVRDFVPDVVARTLYASITAGAPQRAALFGVLAGIVRGNITHVKSEDVTRWMDPINAAAATKLAVAFRRAWPASSTADAVRRLTDSGTSSYDVWKRRLAVRIAKVLARTTTCAHCGKTQAQACGSMRPCKGCHCVTYCNTACQRAAWRPLHKAECGLFKI